MMGDTIYEKQMLAGGYGGYGYGAGYGYGGYGCGIVPVYDICGDRRRRDRDDDCERMIELVSDNINSRFDSLESRHNTQQIENLIHNVDGRIDAFKDFALTEFGNVKKDIALTGKDVVIAAKDIIHDADKNACDIMRNDDKHFAALLHNQDKGFCEVIRNDDRNAQKILDKLCDMDTARLRDEIAELRSFRNGINIRDSVISGVSAKTVGSNFNTGLQTQSNNSGQIVA